MAFALQAASRESLADLHARLDVFVGQVGAADLDRLAGQLFSVARLLSGETTTLCVECTSARLQVFPSPVALDVRELRGSHRIRNSVQRGTWPAVGQQSSHRD